MTLWELFESVVARAGDAIAVEVQRDSSLETWTYGQLHAAAVAYAQALQARGIRPGDRCALLADNDARWCAAYLGILAAGAVVVPIDTNYPVAEVATTLREVRPRVLLVDERHEQVAGEAAACDAVPVQGLWRERPAPSAPSIVTPATLSDTAVVVYTSGTTADAKGVMLTQANLLAARDAALAVIDLSERDSVLGVLPLSDAFAQLANLLLPLTVGARVVLLDRVTLVEVMRLLAERQITVLVCTPQFLYLLHRRLDAEVARSGWLAQTAFRFLRTSAFRLRGLGFNAGRVLFRRVHGLLGGRIRLFITGGSAFDPSIGRDFYALGFTTLKVYGLTETSGVATISRPDEAHIDTVGCPLPGQEIRIFRREDLECDGEIAVRGPVVMQGYVNRPDETAAVVRDGWLLTGDLGRVDVEGRLTIAGRKKDAIVLASGKNIDPDTIEAQYRRSAFVKEMCVMSVSEEDQPATQRLFAIVVPDMDMMRNRRIANAGDLLRFEIEGQSIHLSPDERVLEYEVWFEPLPRTRTGTLKRHEIERRVRQKQQARVQRASLDEHWGADDHALHAAAIIARHAKGIVAPEANLELDLALDSMERVELIAELEQRFGVRVSGAQAHGILTVSQLIEAVRPGSTAPAGGAVAESSWAVMLRHLPQPTDPLLGSLLRERVLVPLVFFTLLRLLRLLAPRVVHAGMSNLPAEGPYILSPNHQSYLDPFFVCSVLPYRVLRRLFLVGATEYFETPLAAWVARQLNLVPVDPDANLVPAMRAGAFGLAHGRILMLFPEGERSIDGTVKRFKKGAPILSRHLGAAIVPVAIHGLSEVWPRNRPLNWRLLLPWSGHTVRLTFGPPMTVGPETSYAEGAATLRQRVQDMWDVSNALSEKRCEQQDA